ncbi:MAG: L,D-transpeptidase [Fimbriimonadaceae bacterium]|nr:MAG: L,D-transpeptidase [Fimbriimonadaceae bacterium]
MPTILNMVRLSALFVSSCICGIAMAQRGPTVLMPSEFTIEGVTFASDKGAVYVPVMELEDALEIGTDWDTKKQSLSVGEKTLSKSSIRTLFDGTLLVDINDLQGTGITNKFDDESDEYVLSSGHRETYVTVGKHWVEIDLTSQRLRGFQGERLIIDTKISSGKKGMSTPTGSYKAGPEKSKYRTSSLYEDAPMPFSVQFQGNYFIHGSSSVPNYPASHGCIRMPLTGQNAAKFFFEWVNIGSEVEIRRGWSEKVQALITPKLDANR